VNMSILSEKHCSSQFYSLPTLKPINFYCAPLKAASVQLAGSFNDWDPLSHPMACRVDGWWFIQVLLPHGHHQYQFLIDGQAVLDPEAMGAADNPEHGKVSIVAVS
jgi:1,4-alpha-glucan branching enzyme